MKLADYYLVTFSAIALLEEKSIREELVLTVRAKPVLDNQGVKIETPEFFHPEFDIEQDPMPEVGICDLRSQLKLVAGYIAEKKHRAIDKAEVSKVSIRKITPCADYHAAVVSDDCKHTVVRFNLYLN